VLDARQRRIGIAPGLLARGSVHAGEQDAAQDTAGGDEDGVLGQIVAFLLRLGGDQADLERLGASGGLGADRWHGHLARLCRLTHRRRLEQPVERAWRARRDGRLIRG
jgi:hypothetical protein